MKRNKDIHCDESIDLCDSNDTGWEMLQTDTVYYDAEDDDIFICRGWMSKNYESPYITYILETEDGKIDFKKCETGKYNPITLEYVCESVLRSGIVELGEMY